MISRRKTKATKTHYMFKSKKHQYESRGLWNIESFFSVLNLKRAHSITFQKAQMLTSDG